MFLLELWDRYLSKTMPSLGNGGVLLVYAQMLIGAVPPLLTLFRSVRRKNAGETVLLCMVPGIFIVTAAIVEPLFFGSFLGAGFPWVTALRRFLYQPLFFREMLLLTGIFSLLAALFFLVSRGTSRFLVLHTVLSVGAEAVVAAAALALGMDYFLGRGQMFWALGDQALKLLVYGLYLLLYKGTLFLVCLIWCLLFSERRDRAAQRGDYLLWFRHWCAQGSRTVAWGLLLFAGLWAFAVVRGLYEEGGWAEAGWTVPVLLVMVLIGLLSLARGILPGLNGNFRRFMTWDDPEETARLLYQEMVQLPPLVHTDLGDLTKHFLIMKVPRRVFLRSLLDREKSRTGGNINVLRFRDGGSCRINGVAYRALLDLLLRENPWG